MFNNLTAVMTVGTFVSLTEKVERQFLVRAKSKKFNNIKLNLHSILDLGNLRDKILQNKCSECAQNSPTEG